MIGQLTGQTTSSDNRFIIFDVNGVGYKVFASNDTINKLRSNKEKVAIWTHLVVREDAHLLFGFLTHEERVAFRQLLKISGVGPKLALSVLSGLSLGDLAVAVANKDATRLTKIPGVGKKTAERLLLELQGKFSVTGAGTTQGAPAASSASDIVNALLALGYNEKEADWAAKQLPKEAGVSDGIRQALKLLSKA